VAVAPRQQWRAKRHPGSALKSILSKDRSKLGRNVALAPAQSASTVASAHRSAVSGDRAPARRVDRRQARLRDEQGIMRPESSRVNGLGGSGNRERASDGYRISHAINALKSPG
jgi:hypothetical protein